MRQYFSKSLFIIWAIGLGLAILASIVQIIIPRIIKNFINFAIKINFQGIDLTRMILLFGCLLSLICISQALIGFTSERAMLNIRLKIFERLLQDGPQIAEMPISEIANRLTNDNEVFGKYLSTTLPNLIKNCLIFIGSLIGLTTLNAKLSFVLLICLAVLFLIINCLAAIIATLGQKFKTAGAKYLGLTINHLNNAPFISVFKRENFLKTRQTNQAKILFRLSFQAIMLQALAVPIQFLLLIAILIALFVILAKQLQQGLISPGTITAILLYMFNIVSSAGSLSESYFDLRQDQGQLKGLVRLNKTLNSAPIRSNILISDNKYCIIADHISVTVKDQTIVNNFTYKFEFGKNYLISGENGSGKTSLVSALLQIYPLSSGILQHSTKAKIAFVPQKPSLLIGTIRENLTLGAELSDQLIIQTLIDVHLWQDFKSHNGLDYFIDEQNSLSGGQLQKLAIARALLNKANVLILDEITSNLDAESTRAVKNIINHLASNITIIEITHSQPIKADSTLIRLSPNMNTRRDDNE